MDNSLIRQGSVEEAVALSQLIPEFDSPHGADEYERRFQNVPHLILIAEVNGNAAGFKVGYQRGGETSFYSWMGGVLPAFRRQHLARQLALVQEQWAKEKGYRKIVFRTRNRHKAMLLFGIKNGFQIVSVEPRPEVAEHRIVLEKNL